jgi:hypothetical protein
MDRWYLVEISRSVVRLETTMAAVKIKVISLSVLQPKEIVCSLGKRKYFIYSLVENVSVRSLVDSKSICSWM